MSVTPRRLGQRVARILLAGLLVAASVLALAATASASTSSKVGYVTDFGEESANDPTFTGSSIFVNALTGTTPGATYTTADSSKTVTLTDVPVKAIDSAGEAALTPFDTLIVYGVCDIASHPKTIEAINTFLTNGGKVMIFDADRCAEGVVVKPTTARSCSRLKPAARDPKARPDRTPRSSKAH